MSSADYWKKRETEQKKKNIVDEEEYAKHIKEIYDDMSENIQKEIDAFYTKYAKKKGISLTEAKKRVSELDIKAYERKAKKYVKEAAKDRKANKGKTNYQGDYFSKEANDEMEIYNLTMKVNRLEMLKANIGLELIKGHDELQTYMEEILQGRTMEELERQAGILGKTVRNNAKTANAIVNASFHNATFSDRIWTYQNVLKYELSELLQKGIMMGKNPRVLAKELRKRFDVTEADAERLMRTELSRVQTEAQKQSFIENGFTQYTFLALGDACGDCMRIDGNHYDIEDMMPGTNAPPMHPNCRCSIAAYEDDDEYEAWLDYLDKGGTTEEWNKSGRAAWLMQSIPSGAKSQYAYKSENVYYDEESDYSVALEAFSERVNAGLTEAAINVAKKGSEDGFEHMYLVDLLTGELVYYETNGAPGAVGIDFVEYAKEHLDINFAFVHNHNIISSLSESDLITPVINPNIPVQIAVQNDGVKYIVIRTKDSIKKFYPDFYYEDALEELNEMSRGGKITANERIAEREKIIINELLKEFYEEGILIQDGRKHK